MPRFSTKIAIAFAHRRKGQRHAVRSALTPVRLRQTAQRREPCICPDRAFVENRRLRAPS